MRDFALIITVSPAFRAARQASQCTAKVLNYIQGHNEAYDV